MMALSADRPTGWQLPTGKLLQLCTAWLCLCIIAPTLLATPNIAFEVVARYPHRSTAFTQGLELIGDTLYESSGLYGKSFVARWQLRDEAPIATRRIAPEYFAEGLTVLGERLYLLTWQSGIGLVLNTKTFAHEATFTYPGEGWGLTHNQRQLIMSDGSNRLRFLDPQTLREMSTLAVTEHGQPVDDLNELEWIDAGIIAAQPRLLANIWKRDRIVVIDPVSGTVTAQIDLDKLYPQHNRRSNEDVLNGIAYDAADNTLLVTGKLWRYLWRIRLLQPLP